MSAIVLFKGKGIDQKKREALVEAFRKADKNHDGRLSAEEVHGIYVSHGFEISLEEVKRMVEVADKDGSGMLTEKEFVDGTNSGELPVSRLFAPLSAK
jgi:Ca2+-binding EF-hand superfamily protein